jgi:hypothetical protein
LKAQIIWVGTRGEDLECMEGAGEIAGVICCDWTGRLEQLSRLVGIDSLERRTGVRELYSSASITNLNHALVHQVADSRRGETWVVPYRASAELEAIAARRPEISLHGPSAALVAYLDDKITQRQLFRDWGLPVPRWTIVTPGDVSRRQQSMPFPVVLQRRRGSMGRDAVALTGMDDLERAVPKEWHADDSLLLSEFVAGPVVNVNAVVTPAGGMIAPPSVQITGQDALGSRGRRFLYCGNDFGAASELPSMALRRLAAVCTELADRLRALGYHGLFGADFIVCDERVLLLEINPRFQGSTAMLTRLELDAGRRPTANSWLTGRPLLDQGDVGLLQGAEMVVHCAHQITLPAGPAAAPPITVRGFPTPGTTVSAGAIIAKLRMDGRALGGDLSRLTAKAQDVLESFWRSFNVPRGLS